MAFCSWPFFSEYREIKWSVLCFRNNAKVGFVFKHKNKMLETNL